MSPNLMPAKAAVITKAPRPERKPRPIRNNQLADALRQKGIAR